MIKTIKNTFIGVIAIALTSCLVTTPVTVTNNPIGNKEGGSKNNCLNLGVPSYAGQDFFRVSGGLCFSYKKYGLADAAQDGGISRIATVDLKTTNYLFFVKYELIVTGE